MSSQSMSGKSAVITIYVCRNCRLATEAPEPMEDRAGARLHASLAEAAAGQSDVKICPVDCLSVCKRPVTVGFAAAGKWTYVYGDFAPDMAGPLIDYARLFAGAPEGLIPWRQRPDALKRGVVARIPPLPETRQ